MSRLEIGYASGQRKSKRLPRRVKHQRPTRRKLVLQMEPIPFEVFVVISVLLWAVLILARVLLT